MKALRIASFVLSILLANAAHATLVQRDLSVASDGLITFDGATGLEWLDVPLSAGLNRQDVLDQLRPGGRFDGFRLANRNQVAQLFANGGLGWPAPPRSSSPEELAAAQRLMDLVGYTGAFNGLVDLAGMTADLANEPNYGLNLNVAVIEFAAYGVKHCAAAAGCVNWVVDAHADPLQRSSWVGAFLYRPDTAVQIPLPATPALFALGLLAMAQRRKFLGKR